MPDVLYFTCTLKTGTCFDAAVKVLKYNNAE